MTTPNIRNLRKWVRALRSGKYKQTTQKLRRKYADGYRYCVLGVCCAVSRTGRWNGESYVTEEGQNAKFLPKAVLQWLGIAYSEQVALTKSGEPVRLMALNDERRYTFPEIANAIERTWPEVKVKKEFVSPRKS